MKPIPIAQYLNQLERDAPGPATDKQPRRDSPLLKPRLIASVTPPPQSDPRDMDMLDMPTRLEQAYERGVRDGRMEANAEHDKRQSLLDADRESRMQRDREEFRANEYACVADAITAGLVEIEERIALSVSNILKPYLFERQRKLLIEALVEDIHRLYAVQAPPLLRVSGPENAITALREKLSRLPVEVEYSLNDAVEVVVLAQDTRIESQLKAWAEAMSAIGA